jgi:hypothetical protein
MYSYPENQLPLEIETGKFIGREVQLEQFRNILRELLKTRRGLFGSRKDEISPPGKSLARVVEISGLDGYGKTLLSLQMRYITRHEREFKGKFRVSRLDWSERLSRDQRVAHLRNSSRISPDDALDVIYNHFVREDFESQFEVFRRERETGSNRLNSQATLEQKARALGQSFRQAAHDKPLVFFLDNYQGNAELGAILPIILLESGSQVVWLFSGGEVPAEVANITAPERYYRCHCGPLNDQELFMLLETEFNSYSLENGVEPLVEIKSFRYEENLGLLREITRGSPLAVRMATYLLATGIPLEDMPRNKPEPLTTLLEAILDEPLGPGHPDRLRLYSLFGMRRPEAGLLSALLDLRQDMLSPDELAMLLQIRYSFLFEPTRQMVLHPALEVPIRRWLMRPESRYSENGMAKINRRAVEFLGDRLKSWGQNFLNLPERVRDIKWSNWALDLIWYAFWLDERNGWKEALPLFLAGMAYKNSVAQAVLELTEQIFEVGGLSSEDSRALLKTLRNAYYETAGMEGWHELYQAGNKENWFSERWPQFTAEFEYVVAQKLGMV